MAITVTMPRLSDTMEEGTLVKWHVGVGDDVSAGDHVADVETDKATMELQAFDDGKVARLAVDEGGTVPVGDLILVLAESGESVDDAAKADAGSGGASGGDEKMKADESRDKKEGEQTQESAASGQAAVAEDADVRRTQKQAGASGGRVRVSPLARKIAEEKDLDLTQIKGSGPDGRIIKRDVLKAADGKDDAAAPSAGGESKKTAAPAPAPAVGGADLEARSVSLSGMRKTIAKRLVESKTTIPHFTVTVSVNMDPLMELRKTLNAQLESQGVKLSVNDFITRAAALACVQHPMVNASWNGDTIEIAGTVNVGIAVALPEERGGGLVVPVLRDVQNQGLRSISEQTRKLAKKARETGLSADEMGGGTFTISNLGMYGVDHFEAIINPPQSAILAVGGAIKKPVVRDDQIVIGHEMTATLSADHRVIDGAIAAEYLNTLKQMIENPAGLLV
ncbi:pyruvate dehydrogenase complex dihydrolipoamide acetyltransferase [Phycisphaerales bacterium AB-hyl4]|uniref:Acetyltransferase component of pyruvate dehydrogenase complex n=1 Tax=Natronomicrosphaera hydrolytica TaxID=3242702 RepID=A0ABV4U9A8_9BACT